MTRSDPAIIRAARAKITPEGAWTQNSLARDKRGHAVASRYSRAVCWCFIGAMRSCGGGIGEISAAKDYLGVFSLAKWNDDPSRTHAEVLAAMDGCADALEQGRL